MKRTALYDKHLESNAKIVDFTGYALPIQYAGIVAEHTMVREKCGMFDVSHMGEILITGDRATEFVQYIITNDISGIDSGDVRYTPMCYTDGGTVDDILVYKMSDTKYYLVVNAANLDKDFAWIVENNHHDVNIQNLSDTTSQIAVQGPMAARIVGQYFDDVPEKNYTFIHTPLKNGRECILSRTGYTGEDGFEIYCDNESIADVWQAMLDLGGEDIAPCGLGARDTLRLEAAMPLYGHELSKEISPLEAGLPRFVHLDKEGDFLGKETLTRQKEEGLKRRRCAMKITGKGIAREGAKVYYQGEEVGFVTSGTRSVTLKQAIALAMVKRPYNKIGTELEIEVRNKMIPAINVKIPFYRKG